MEIRLNCDRTVKRGWREVVRSGFIQLCCECRDDRAAPGGKGGVNRKAWAVYGFRKTDGVATVHVNVAQQTISVVTWCRGVCLSAAKPGLGPGPLCS